MAETEAKISKIQKDIDRGEGNRQALEAQKVTWENDVKRDKADKINAMKVIKEEGKKLDPSLDVTEEIDLEGSTPDTSKGANLTAAGAHPKSQ